MSQVNIFESGPLLITHWGLSGPAVLKLSSWGAFELADRSYYFPNFHASPYFENRGGGRRYHNENFKGRPRGRGGQGKPHQKNGFAHEGKKPNTTNTNNTDPKARPMTKQE